MIVRRRFGFLLKLGWLAIVVFFAAYDAPRAGIFVGLETKTFNIQSIEGVFVLNDAPKDQIGGFFLGKRLPRLFAAQCPSGDFVSQRNRLADFGLRGWDRL